MTETANILNNASPRSLIILDEIGRVAEEFAGVETIIYNEGQLRRDGDFVRNPNHDDVKFQVGPVLGVYKRSWDAGLRLGVGGGDYGVYGTMSLWKTFAL